MEEIKTKKKLNKKPLIICLLLALVFGIVGFMDIKSNAAESGKLLEVVTYNSNGTERVEYSRILNYTEDYELYWYAPSDTFYTGYFECFLYVVSKEHSGLGNDYDHGFVMNGETYYVTILHNSSTSFDGNGYKAPRINGKVVTKVDKGMYHSEFAQNYIAGNIKPDIDFGNLPIDDNMLVPSNLKRNVILNDTNISTGLYMDTYDLVTWNNTSEEYRIELQRCPVVQIYKTPLFGSNEFVKEFVGEWKTEQIFEEITNEYLKRTDTKGLLDEDADTLIFKGNLTYDLSGLEQDYIYFGYRIRYVDLENNVASPWLVLMPTHSKDNYETFLEYCDSSQGDKTDGNGIVNEYKDLEDLNGAIDDVKTENNFKDKYEIVDGNADTHEVMNWLNTVVSFIKGTPNIVTSVLSFLPQPIRYGMYIIIYLGCIASAIAIVKALI